MAATLTSKEAAKSSPIEPPAEHLIADISRILATSTNADPEDIYPHLSPFAFFRLSVEFDSAPSCGALLRFLAFGPTTAQSSTVPHHDPELSLEDAPSFHRSFLRLDKETLQARYVWPRVACVLQWYDSHSPSPWLAVSLSENFQVQLDLSKPITGWKLERIEIEDSSSAFNSGSPKWSPSIAEAEQEFQRRSSARSHPEVPSNRINSADSPEKDSDSDDDYWAMYEERLRKQEDEEEEEHQTGHGNSTNVSLLRPMPKARTPVKSPAISISEEDYFRQYDDVQPALDPREPPARSMITDGPKAQQNAPNLSSLSAPYQSVQTDNPTVTHIKESLQSLLKLARSGGIDSAQFASIVSEVVLAESRV